ncbi:MAG: endonuclease/exonuclease/phosphatase [Massilia sp.]|nr:endonuclease/exonuclease/phosphatase [Massilia sp.]
MKKPLAEITFPGRKTVLAALLTGLTLSAYAALATPPANHVVISQVYAGGGNSSAASGTATYKTDFVELFNPTGAAIDLTGWTLQYGSATSDAGWSGKAGLSGSIDPGKYLLVKMQGGTNGVDLPEPTLAPTGPFNMAAGGGKVALVSNTVTRTGITPQAAGLVDFIGWGSANGSETSPAPAPSGTTTNLRSVVRSAACTDIDNNGTEFSVIDVAPRNSETAAVNCGGAPPPPPEAKPIVASCPALSVMQGVGGSGPLSATDEDSIVNSAIISSGAVAGISLGGFSAAGSDGQPGSVSLIVASTVAQGTYALGFTFGNNEDQTATCSASVTVQNAGAATLTIMEIQGHGAPSTYNNTVRTVDGVVTFKFAGTGFFIQDQNGDGDPTTSDGIMVFGSSTTAAIGDIVRVTGTVFEYKPAGQPVSYTEIKDATSITRVGAGTPIQPTNIAMPTDLSSVQGMLVRFTRPLVINQVSSLGDRGEMTLASVRREVPTNRYKPGTAQAVQMAADNELDQIVLDDGSFTEPNPIPFIGADKTVRAGDSVSDLVGVVDFGSIGNSNNGYKLQMTSPQSVLISRTNARTAGPDVPAGNVRVASANVLNFFTTFTDGTDVTGATGQGCTLGSSTSKSNCRGADNLTEFKRQRDKIVNELVALNADVVGLMEIQNNGNTAVSYLVDQLNGVLGAQAYAYVPLPPSTGTDAIRVAMIYKPAVVSLSGAAMSDGNTVNNRPPLAQTFKAGNGARFSVIVNHLKSKGSCPSGTGLDADAGDSQGCWNATRVTQAQRLASYFIPQVQSTSGDPDVLVIGDMNSHGFEDPINVLTDAGMVNQLERFQRPNGVVYSYVFDGLSAYLDHALASASLSGQVAGATEWHNNADEPDVIDYNLDGKSQDLYVNNAYRASDHDPVVISLNLAPTFIDVTAQGSVTLTGATLNRVTGKYTGKFAFTNKTGAAINGPFMFELSGLTAGVTLDNASGSHNGAVYVSLGNTSIAPNETISTPLTFTNPSKATIGYTPVVYAGSF